MTSALILIGIGAGAASALLFAAAASGSPFALMLLYVAPLPILLAGVGWRHHAGIVATVVGAAILGLTVGPKSALSFALVVGAPSWWLSYLALLARPGATEAETEWYPIGRLVFWCAGLGALLVSATIPLIATSLEEYQATLRAAFTQALEAASPGGLPPTPGGQDPKALIDFMVQIAPIVAASFWTLSSIANLWLAGRICRASGRLVRPWPDIASLELPRGAGIAFALAFAGSFLSGLPGLVSELFASTFLIAFMIQGLAVMHVTTRLVPGRGLILFALYMLLAWIGVFVAGLGIAEQLIGIRRRFGPPRGGPPPPANLP